jgi:hypothetical protein
MLESGLSGSVRGVPSNAHSYRDPRTQLRHLLPSVTFGRLNDASAAREPRSPPNMARVRRSAMSVARIALESRASILQVRGVKSAGPSRPQPTVSPRPRWVGFTLPAILEAFSPRVPYE